MSERRAFEGKRGAEGFTLIELMIVVAVLSILSLVAIPNFMALRENAYDAVAKYAGKSAQICEHAYHQFHGEKWADSLEQLMEIDRNLTDDAAVTFNFIEVNNSGFTLYVRHQNSKTIFTFND